METHADNSNRAPTSLALASNRPSGGKWEGRTWGGVSMRNREEESPEQLESEAERRRRRAQFLRDLTEARELRDRVQPRRAKTARLRHAMRMRTFRW
jgi:hypothetical protein